MLSSFSYAGCPFVVLLTSIFQAIAFPNSSLQKHYLIKETISLQILTYLGPYWYLVAFLHLSVCFRRFCMPLLPF